MTRGNERILRIMSESGGEPREVGRFQEGEAGFGWLEWAPDAKRLFFPRSNPPKDNFTLWSISTEGGEPQKHQLAMAHFENLSVHPDGDRLAFSSDGAIRRPPSVWVMENFLPESASAE
jgi:Tol biopolymer transport system component